MTPNKQEYEIVKMVIEAYEAKTGEKVTIATITMDKVLDDYLKEGNLIQNYQSDEF